MTYGFSDCPDCGGEDDGLGCPFCGSDDDREPNPDVLYPNVKVKLVGSDGNAFSIMGKVSAALRRHGVPKEEIDRYTTESMSGDYNHLLRTAMRWVDVSWRL
jgi:hypothetical protein